MRIGKYVVMAKEELKNYHRTAFEAGVEVGDKKGYERGRFEADPMSSVGEIVKLCADDPYRTRLSFLKSKEPGSAKINYSLFLQECRNAERMTGEEVRAEIEKITGGL